MELDCFNWRTNPNIRNLKSLVKSVDKILKVGIIERVEKLRSVGQGVKTPPFHGGNTGSNPVRTMSVLQKKMKKVWKSYWQGKEAVIY